MLRRWLTLSAGGRTLVGGAALPGSRRRQESVGDPASHTVPDDDGRSAVRAGEVADRRALHGAVRRTHPPRLQVPLAVADGARSHARVQRTDVPAPQLHRDAMGQATCHQQLLQLLTMF